MPELNLHSDGNGFKYCVRFLFLFSTNLQEFQENLFFFLNLFTVITRYCVSGPTFLHND